MNMSWFQGMLALMVMMVAVLITPPAHAGFQGIDQTGKSLKIFDTLRCDAGLECTKLKGSFVVKVSGQQASSTTAATQTLTSADCGKSFKNSAASVVTLPSVTAALVGCRLTFLTANASNFDVDPTGTERILALTDAAGDKIRNATVGNSITLEAISTGNWAAVSIYGTWTDAN